MSWLLNKIKTIGVGAAINALDNLEKPLGDRFQASIDEFRKLDGHGAAILIIDQVQDFLRAYFKIEPPKK